MRKEKIKVRIRKPVICTLCHRCKRFDYILGIGCKNCDLEVVK